MPNIDELEVTENRSVTYGDEFAQTSKDHTFYKKSLLRIVQ